MAYATFPMTVYLLTYDQDLEKWAEQEKFCEII